VSIELKNMVLGEQDESNTPYTIGRHRVYSYKPIDSWWCSRPISGNKEDI
jgi:hypothetical protein